MKKVITILFLLTSVGVYAQDEFSRRMHENYYRGFTILATFCLIIFFVLTILQRILDHRLRNKIIDKGITDGLAASLLTNNPKENTQSTIKWFCLLAVTGIGLLIVHYNLPLSILSVAIMAISLSLGFLGYYFFLTLSEKKR